MPKLLSTTALTSVLSVGVSLALTGYASADTYNLEQSLVSGMNVQNTYTVINLAGEGAPLSMQIVNSTLASGNTEVTTGAPDNGTITSAALDTLTFNGTNLLYATVQTNDSLQVGGQITLNATNLNVLGESSNFITELRVDSSDNSLITLNATNMGINNSTLLLNGTSTVVVSDTLSMGNGGVLNFGETGTYSVNATNGYSFTGNTTVQNLSEGSVSLSGGTLHAITSAGVGSYANFIGNVVVGAVSIDAGSTMAFNNVTFTSGSLTDSGTLDLTGNATFQQATDFNDGGTTNIHDAVVNFVNPTVNVTGSTMLFSGNNTVYVATSGIPSGLGLTLNNNSSVLKVTSGETTINGLTDLQQGTLHVAGGVLNLTDFNYEDGDGLIALDNGATLNLTANANLSHSTSFISGTLGLTGGSVVTLGENSDMSFTNSTLSLQGVNNQIVSSTNSQINIGEGASLTATSTTSSILNDAGINVAGGAINVDSASTLTLSGLTYQTSGSGVQSTFTNSGNIILTDNASFLQPVQFSSGAITLNNTTFAAHGSSFTGAQLNLAGNNTITEDFVMTGGTLLALGSGNTVFEQSTELNTDLTIPAGYVISFMGSLQHNGRLTNTGLLTLGDKAVFAQGINFNSGTLLLTNNANVYFQQPSVLAAGGTFEVADNTAATINGNLSMTGGTISFEGTGSSLRLLGSYALSGTTNVTSAAPGSTYSSLTLGQNAYMSLATDALLNANLDMEPGSYLSVNVSGTPGAYESGMIAGALTATGAEAATVGLVVPSSFVQGDTASVQVAGSNAGNLALDNNNLMYNFAWNSNNTGTVEITRKSLSDVRTSLLTAGSSYNQAQTIAGTISEPLTAGSTLSNIADAFSTDIQTGNLARANLNADVLNPSMAPVALVTAVSNTEKIYSAVSSRFFSSNDRERNKKSRQVKSNSINQERQEHNKTYNPYMQNYYNKQNMQQSNNNLSQDEFVVSSYYDEFTGKASGDITNGRAGMWVDVFYGQGKFDEEDSIPGFDLTTYGAAIGLDYALDDVRFGIGYAYTQNETEDDGRDAKIKGHTGFLYGEYMPNNWYINGLLSYTMSSYDENKTPYGMSIDSDFDGNAFAVEAMSGYSFGHWAPEVGIRYINASVDNYTDSAGQQIDMDDASVWTALAGIRGSIGSIFNWRIAATYDISQSKSNAVVVLPNNVSYELNGAEMNKFGGELGLSLDFRYFALSYEGVLRDGYQNHSGLLQIRYQW